MFALPVVSGIKQALIILFVFNNKKKKLRLYTVLINVFVLFYFDMVQYRFFFPIQIVNPCASAIINHHLMFFLKPLF